MSRDCFGRAGRLHKGYHRRQVDAFLNHVEVSLGGVFPPLTGAEIRQAGFELVRGGYLVAEVDEYLDALEDRVLVMQNQQSGRRGRVDPESEAAFLRGELAAPYLKRFPRAGALHRGYHPDDVDEFVDRVVAALADAARPITAEEVRAARFRPRRGGYLEDSVDEALDGVVELLLVLRREAGTEEDVHPI